MHYLKKELYELIRSENRIFDFLQKGSLDGIWYWNLEKPEDEWMSPEFWELLGYDPALMKHNPSEWQGIINADDLNIAVENFNRHLDDESHPYDQIVRYKHANGSTVWVRCRGIAFRDLSGKAVRMLGAHNNVTPLKELEQKQQRNIKALDELYSVTKVDLEEAAQIFDCLPIATFMVDECGYITKSNSAASELLGYKVSDLINKNIDQLIPERSRSGHNRKREAYFENPSKRAMLSSFRSVSVLHSNGYEIPVEISLNTVNTRHGTQVLCSMVDVSEQQQAIKSLETALRENSRLSHQVMEDSLTKLKNRRYFETEAESAFDCSVRNQSDISIVMVDVDHFKQINDRYGHDVGDTILLSIAGVLQSNVRHGDTVARLGGDEFVIVLPATSHLASEMLAERIRSEVAGSVYDLNGTKLDVTLSIGIGTRIASDKDFLSILKRADSGLYQAKKLGRDRVVVFYGS